MGQLWRVVFNSGQNAAFECGVHRIIIEKPESPYARSVFMNMKPGMLIDETLMKILMGPSEFPE